MAFSRQPKHSILQPAIAFARIYLTNCLLRLAHPLVWRFGSADRKIRFLDREICKLDEIDRLCEIAEREFGATYEQDDRLAYTDGRAYLMATRDELSDNRA